MEDENMKNRQNDSSQREFSNKPESDEMDEFTRLVRGAEYGKDKSLSAGAIFGIVAGVVLLIGGIVAITTGKEKFDNPYKKTETNFEMNHNDGSHMAEENYGADAYDSGKRDIDDGLRGGDKTVDPDLSQDDQGGPISDDTLVFSTDTPTPIPTNTPVPTDTPTPLPTDTPVPTNTPVPVNTATPTDTPVPTAAAANTATPVPTEVKASPTTAPTLKATNTPTPKATKTPTPKATNTPTPKPTKTPTPKATKTPTPKATNTPTPKPTKTPTPKATKTPTPKATNTPTPKPTKTPTPKATKTPTPKATNTPTPKPTKTPTPKPTKTPTPKPTKTPTPTPINYNAKVNVSYGDSVYSGVLKTTNGWYNGATLQIDYTNPARFPVTDWSCVIKFDKPLKNAYFGGGTATLSNQNKTLTLKPADWNKTMNQMSFNIETDYSNIKCTDMSLSVNY